MVKKLDQIKNDSISEMEIVCNRREREREKKKDQNVGLANNGEKMTHDIPTQLVKTSPLPCFLHSSPIPILYKHPYIYTLA